MAQFYLLSVLANLVAGLTLAGDYLGEKFQFLASFKNLRENKKAQTVIGIIAAAIGIIKLFILSPEETVPIIGDLLPALAGIVLGGILLIEAYRPHVEKRGKSVEKISKMVLTYRVPVGIAGVIIAILHFLFPGVVLL